MIRKLAIQNYRSIRSLELDLEPFNCLIGANNSGKSNILDTFSFLSATAEHGLHHAIQTRDGMEKILHHGASSPDSITLETFMDAPPSFDGEKFRYFLRFDSNFYPVQEEILEVYPESEDSAYVRFNREGAPGQSYGLEYGEGSAKNKVSGSFEQGQLSFLHRPAHPYMENAAPALTFVNEYLRGIRHYRFVPDQLESEGRAVYSDRLAMDGSNFASYLHDIQSGHRKVFNRIEEQLRNNFPEIEELITPLVEDREGMTEVGIREIWFPELSSGKQLSDGLIGFLAPLVVLFGPEQPTVAIFEEPENYINPNLLERLVKMFKEASSDIQILISTHSVVLLNYLSLEDVVVVERVDGGSEARRVSDREALRDSLEGWALGDAYASGMFDNAD